MQLHTLNHHAFEGMVFEQRQCMCSQHGFKYCKAIALRFLRWLNGSEQAIHAFTMNVEKQVGLGSIVMVDPAFGRVHASSHIIDACCMEALFHEAFCGGLQNLLSWRGTAAILFRLHIKK